MMLDMIAARIKPLNRMHLRMAHGCDVEEKTT
jgi:hypothetical protein